LRNPKKRDIIKQDGEDEILAVACEARELCRKAKFVLLHLKSVYGAMRHSRKQSFQSKSSISGQIYDIINQSINYNLSGKTEASFLSTRLKQKSTARAVLFCLEMKRTSGA